MPSKIASKGLFVDLADQPYPSSQADGSRLAGLDIPVLREMLASGQTGMMPPQLNLKLFDDLELDFRTALIEPFGADGIIWRGQLAGVPDVRGYLSIMGLKGAENRPIFISGHVVLNGQNFLIQSAGADTVRIARTRPLPTLCGDALFPPGGNVAATYYEGAGLTESSEDMAMIHVLALYSSGARAAITGGAAGIDAMMATAQSLTNEAFLHSGISARVDVTAQELSVLPNVDPELLLEQVTKVPGSAMWNAVTEAREKAQASIVALLTSEIKIVDLSWVAGKAARIPEPPRYDASDLSYATFAMALAGDPYTFTHELGHLLGGKHDRLTQPGRAGMDPEYDYARGYVPADKSFVTVMGYQQVDINYVPAYSAADKTWQGKALGIPMGQPDAADAAHLFRLSTRVVAGYRGTGAPRWDPIALKLSVTPSLGGTATPSALGPYPKDSIVEVRAIPRTGYRFAHWTLDDKDASSQLPTISVKMDRERTLVAHFNDGGEGHTLSVKSLPIGENMQVRLTPPGPTYPPGTDVYAELTGSSLIYAFEQWFVDDQPAGSQPGLTVRMEQDHRVEARVTERKQLYKGTDDAIVEAGTAHTLVARVLGAHDASVPDQWVTFSLQETSTGSQLVGLTRVQTDRNGRASATLRVGRTAGSAKVTATLENSTATPVVFDVVVPKRFIIPITEDRQHIFDGDPGIPFVVQVRELGSPVKAGTKVHFEMEGHTDGLKLTPTEPETDASGRATAVLTRADSSSGVFFVTAKTGDAPSPVRIRARCVSERTISASSPLQTLVVGSVPKPFAVNVADDGEDAPNIPVHFILASGTTGLTLESDMSITDNNGFAQVNAHAPTAVGVAKITPQAAHMTSLPEPAMFEVRVISGTGSLQVVSGDAQAIKVGTVPAALVAQVLDSGKPVGAGVKVFCSIKSDTTGLSLVNATDAQTNESGQISLVFAGPSKSAGQAEISVSTETAPVPAVFHVRVFAKRIVEYAWGENQTITVGEAPAPLVAAVFEDDRHAPKGVTVRFKMNSGTTGLRLEADSAQTNERGRAEVKAGVATGAGEATVDVSADDAEVEDPPLTTFRILVKPKG